MNTIKCPHCQKPVEISEAFTHQLREELQTTLETKHKADLEEAIKIAEEKAGKKATETLLLQLKDKENESKEMQERYEKLSAQLLELNKMNRELKAKDEERALEMEKRLQSQLEEIKKDSYARMEKEREELARKFNDEHRLKDLEKEKKIADMEKLVEELKLKAQQGSMQTQGEVLELDLEDTLRRTFPHDEIEPVGKGVNGADIRHIVKSPMGTVCGVILWESKRTKAWTDGWLTKLKSDLRAEKANLPAIVSEALPPDAKEGIGMKDGVWICSPMLVLPLALLLRKCLLDVGREKAITANQQGKAESLFSYVTSHAFVQQVESLVETYNEMMTSLAKERTAYEKLWNQREMQIKRLLMGTANICGNMQAIAQHAMPQIKGLELPEVGEVESIPNLSEGHTKQKTNGSPVIAQNQIPLDA